MPVDLRKYIQLPGEWEWIGTEQIRLGGEEQFYKMRRAMILTLHDLPEGKFFDIEKNVKSENQPMFVKIACEWMKERVGINYNFNKLLNKITHEIPIELPLKKGIENEKKVRRNPMD